MRSASVRVKQPGLLAAAAAAATAVAVAVAVAEVTLLGLRALRRHRYQYT